MNENDMISLALAKVCENNEILKRLEAHLTGVRIEVDEELEEKLRKAAKEVRP